ncbi:MAG: alpha-amylase, partial [Muribaculaceae bacterium]|nr:alpha-amylase [Muribaculaceae bacterium]
IAMGVDGFRIDTGGHVARLTFNNAFIPQLHAAGEKYKAKRGGTPFYMYTEVCARAEEVIYRGENYNCSPCFYTWKETKNYPWDYSETSWDNHVVMEGEYGDHTNALSVLQQADDYLGHANTLKSNNAWLNENNYRTEDYSLSSGLNVIDFPMHWRFHSAQNAFGVRSEDNLYNDARWNVVYVDSHDYAPNGNDKCRFSWGTEAWAENLSLMFAWRGIPCLYYGSEIEFQKGKKIDEGPNLALKDSGRAYYGGYITGNVNVTDFAQYTGATGNMAATLASPLAQHIQRLNRLRAAIPALRKGQYSTDGCSGQMAFKRRYTDSKTDSYVLVTISGSST